MKTYLKILSVSLVLLFVMFMSGGCYTTYKNPYKYQPLVGPGKTAKAETAVEKLFFKGFSKVKFRWHKGLFNTVDPIDVIKSCEEYLESNGIDTEYVKIRRNEFDAKTLPWEYWTIRSSLNEEYLREDEAYLKNEFANQDVEFFSKLHVIVCLNPVVVVSLYHPVIRYCWGMGAFNGSELHFKTGEYGSVFTYGGSSAIFYNDSGESFTKKICDVVTNPEGKEIDTSNYDYSAFYWQTCRGYGYGTRIPYKKDIKWFSPELDVLPTAPEFVSDDIRRIKVPWGWLVLEHKADEWIVKGVRK